MGDEEPCRSWALARWAFQRLLTTTQGRFSGDAALVQELEASKALDGLHVDMLAPELASRVRSALRTVGEETLQDAGPGEGATGRTDPEGDRMYAEAIAELLDRLSEVT